MYCTSKYEMCKLAMFMLRTNNHVTSCLATLRRTKRARYCHMHDLPVIIVYMVYYISPASLLLKEWCGVVGIGGCHRATASKINVTRIRSNVVISNNSSVTSRGGWRDLAVNHCDFTTRTPWIHQRHRREHTPSRMTFFTIRTSECQQALVQYTGSRKLVPSKHGPRTRII